MVAVRAMNRDRQDRDDVRDEKDRVLHQRGHR
jgi:hypothetical protein